MFTRNPEDAAVVLDSFGAVMSEMGVHPLAPEELQETHAALGYVMEMAIAYAEKSSQEQQEEEGEEDMEGGDSLLDGLVGSVMSAWCSLCKAQGAESKCIT
jgi:hypothetical protein